MKKLIKFLRKLGPGVITGASDDDPAGVAIYAQTGAVAGTTLLWTAPFTLPFMVAIQEMCARIGLVTGHGLIGTMRRYYPHLLLILIAAFVVIANTINIGADIAGMSASLNLFLPIHPILIALFLSSIIVLLMIYFPYKTLANIFKWLTLALFAYILTAFIVVDNWREVFLNTIFPTISLNKETFLLIVAIFGTTISPYLFFWQASEEAEEKQQSKLVRRIVTKNELKVMREDVALGMFFSNIVMYFIIVTSAKTLPILGITSIQSIDQAAQGIAPLAGKFASLVFTFGIVGTGMLAIPVLAGSAAYAASEAFGWREGLSLSFSKARAFYGVIILATFVGFLMNVLGIPPFRALFFTGIIYGFLSPLVILAILHIANNKDILGSRVNGFISNVLGGATFFIMILAIFASLLLD